MPYIGFDKPSSFGFAFSGSGAPGAAVVDGAGIPYIGASSGGPDFSGGGGSGAGWGGMPYLARGRSGQPLTARPSDAAVSAARDRRLSVGIALAQKGHRGSSAST